MAPANDPVNPGHYRYGRVEVIEIIEDTVRHAPDPIGGYLQGQALKYVCRLWHKGNALEDTLKAQWYLRRLADHLTNRAARTSDV